MNSIKNLLIHVFLLHTCSFLSAQNDFGVIFGGNLATQTFYNPERPQDETTQYNNVLGFNSGIWFNQKIKSKFHLRLNLQYQQIGFKQPLQTGTIGDPLSFQDIIIEDKFNYSSLDIDLIYYFKNKDVSPYIFAGLRNSYLLSHKASYDIMLIKDSYPFNELYDFRNFLLGYKAGLGLKLNQSIHCDISFNRDLTPALKKPSLIAKNWFWSLNFFVGLKDLFNKG